MEHVRGPAGFDLVDGKSVGNHPNGNLDGSTVFECAHFEVLTEGDLGADGLGMAEALVAAGEILVEEAAGLAGECWGLTAPAVLAGAFSDERAICRVFSIVQATISV